MALLAPYFSTTFLGVVTSRVMPSRSISVPRLADSAALPKRSPSWLRAEDTLVAVVHSVFSSPSTARVSGRPMRTAISVPSRTSVAGSGTTESCSPVSMPSRGEDLADGAAEGAHLLALTVHREGDGAAHPGVRRGGADDPEQDRDGESDEEGLVLGQVVEAWRTMLQ